MSIPLTPELWATVFNHLSLPDLRAVRRVCHSFCDESRDALWRCAIADQFEKAPPSLGSPQQTFQGAWAASKRATALHLPPHRPSSLDWGRAAPAASAWAAPHRRAVAEAYWRRASERLSGPRITLRDKIAAVQSLLKIAPGDVACPAYAHALAVLAPACSGKALQALPPAERREAEALLARLTCLAALAPAGVGLHTAAP